MKRALIVRHLDGGIQWYFNDFNEQSHNHIHSKGNTPYMFIGMGGCSSAG